MESRIEHCDLTEKNNTFEGCPATITVKVIIALFANPTVHTGINRVAFSGTPDAHPVDPVGLAILVRLDSLALIKERKFVKIMESRIEHCDLTKKNSTCRSMLTPLRTRALMQPTKPSDESWFAPMKRPEVKSIGRTGPLPSFDWPFLAPSMTTIDSFRFFSTKTECHALSSNL